MMFAQYVLPAAGVLAVIGADAFSGPTLARTGNPDQPGLSWTPGDPDRCQTIVFDNQTRMVDDPEKATPHLLS